MKLEKRKILLGKNNLEIEVAYLDEEDGKEFKRLFDIWRKLNLGLEKYGRKVNIPEVISEGMFCVFSKSVRYQRKISGNGTVSFDTINIEKKRREQIKATSINIDLTSFGPRTQWDDLYFLDFYNEGKLDGTFNVYFIASHYIYENQVNINQTMEDQQGEKRRPRFSIKKDIIQKNNIEPIARNIKVW